MCKTGMLLVHGHAIITIKTQAENIRSEEFVVREENTGEAENQDVGEA